VPNVVLKVVALVVAATTSISTKTGSEAVSPPAAPVVQPAAKHGTELVALIPRRLPILARPGAGPVVGWMPAFSPGFRQRTHALILRRTADHRFGLVRVPYEAGHQVGWIDLSGRSLSRTPIRVDADLSRHLLVVRRRGHVLFRTKAATGAPSTPTPTGRYFVTDRVAFPPSSDYGSFVFGLSGIQPHLPAGWSGGDQLAIHGTNEPWSIGRSVSAGCLRVSEPALQRLKRLLAPGTPVVVAE
jgi:lipoprotein-anchoring transpeptidase ErfK/SrfK